MKHELELETLQSRFQSLQEASRQYFHTVLPLMETRFFLGTHLASSILLSGGAKVGKLFGATCPHHEIWKYLFT